MDTTKMSSATMNEAPLNLHRFTDHLLLST
jgi:hypothetical protein